MGKIEKKFQKKKERERAAHKKILLRREETRKFMKEEKKKQALEHETRRKGIPIHKGSAALINALKMVESIKDSDVDTTDDIHNLPEETTTVTCVSKDCDKSDGK